MFRLCILFESTPPIAQFSKRSPRKSSTLEPVPFNCKARNVLQAKRQIRNTAKNNSRPNEKIIVDRYTLEK